ncbi:glycine--tRNA ligase subunit beta [bacterium]|nr:glycine--tRNA ligase subunit beta [bacterium]MBQ4439311.1 glycine--tRNA ligase subunit beta [bacterium]
MSDFIFEIGYEEFPASFILPFVSQIKEKILSDLEKQRITVGECREFSTCSRTALVCTGLPEKQPDIREKVTGAPKKVALNADGTLSKAGEAFLAKNKITEYFFENSEKGEVIAGYVEEKGKELAEVIAPIVKAALHAANFKKSMRWAENTFAFARPIRWIMLSIDGKPVEDDFEGIKFSSTSFGHRFLSNGALQVNAQNYCETLEAHYIFADRAKRREYINSEVAKKAAEFGLTANIDENLLDEVTDMVEYPHVVIGNIPEKYKNLPVELVVKVLKKDQRYFTLCDKNGQVVKFASVLNNIPRDDSVVVEGNEKVVSARLSDAAFYFNDDLAKDFAALSERLKGVLFQKDLGTYSDKVERICKIAKFIADKCFSLDTAACDRLLTAGKMIKNDLVTGVVFEFPDLQGIMGRYYARHAGFESDVCEAMYEHYLPINAGDELPKTEIGTILSMADKIDTIVGGFMAGMKPSGSKDKFAIRRNAIGFLTVAQNYGLNIKEVVDFAWELVKPRIKNLKSEMKQEIIDFIVARYSAVLSFDTPVIQAAAARDAELPKTVAKRAETIAKVLKESDISGLVQLYKRGCNILKKQEVVPGEVNESLFEQDEEKKLFAEVCKVENEIKTMNDNFEIAMKILSLKPALDAFFDAVFVMHDDIKIRANRMNLIGKVTGLVAENIGEISFLNI